jgi:hemerythrin-like domain-containing protein
MKRAAALIELSREHHEALVLARRACTAAPGSDAAVALCEQLLRRWAAQFEPHFAHEEQALLPALEAAGLADAAARVRAEHARLRALAARLRAGDLAALAPWGDAMQAHVRHEERELFPLAERTLDLDRLPRHVACDDPTPSH